MSIKTLKRRIGLAVQHNRLLKGLATDINFALYHWDERQHDMSFGELNPSVKFYVIRSSGLDEGLLSLYLGRLRQIDRVLREGFVPIVDYEHSCTQYSVDLPVNGTRNAWEYYFEQPCSYSLEEIYKSKNVRLSGWRFFQAYKLSSPARVITQDMMSKAPVKQYVRDLAAERVRADRISDMVGLLVRGTDYTRLRPAGHPVSPSPEQVAGKLDEYLAKSGRNGGTTSRP